MRFLLTGTYNSGNKGDAAMELSAIQALSARYGDGCVTVLSPFPDMDRPFYDPVTVVRCNRRNLIMASIDLVRGLTWRMITKIFGPKSGRWLLSREMRLVADSDLVIDLSGDMLTEDYGPHVAYSHYIPILRALILKRPYFLCAQSIGPFKLTTPLARLIMNKAAAITPRDGITLDYLQGLGIQNPNLVQTADLAFLLEPASPERVHDILDAEQIELGDRPILGISVSQLIESKYNATNAAARNTDFIALMKDAIEHIARRYNCDVLLVSHVTGPSRAKDDRVIAERVRESLAEGVNAFVLKGDYRPDELKAIISMCTVFCGARMHANIGALSTHVPTVAISYSHKTPGIMESCGVENFVVSIQEMTFEELTHKIEDSFNNRILLKSTLSKNIRLVKERALRNRSIIESLMNKKERAER